MCFLSLHSLNTPPLCLPHPFLTRSLSLSPTRSFIRSLTYLARDQEARGCCHVIHVFLATSCLSRKRVVSRGPMQHIKFSHDSPPFLTPRILLIVLLLVSTCMYECVCTRMYMCVRVCVCVCMCVCIHVLKYVYRCARVCMCVLIRVIQSHSPISS